MFHRDNPKNYADNLDARRYDPRLRGPIDERRELSIDPRSGLKNYIANEQIGINTSAGLVRYLFGRSIQLGRQFARTGNKTDYYEALRLMGTGSHCLEGRPFVDFDPISSNLLIFRFLGSFQLHGTGID